MFKKPCKCSTYDKCYGGGGGGGSVNVPSLGQELGQTTQAFNQQVLPSFQNFTQSQPLIGQVEQFGSQAAAGISPYIQNILSNPYSVPADLLNYATQGARGAFQARGDVGSGAAIAGELMNRSAVQQQRLQSALGMAGQTEQLLGYPESVATGNYATLANPLYGLAAAQLGAQTQAGIAGEQAAASGKAGTSGLIGSGIGAIGTAVGGIAL